MSNTIIHKFIKNSKMKLSDSINQNYIQKFNKIHLNQRLDVSKFIWLWPIASGMKKNPQSIKSFLSIQMEFFANSTYQMESKKCFWEHGDLFHSYRNGDLRIANCLVFLLKPNVDFELSLCLGSFSFWCNLNSQFFSICGAEHLKVFVFSLVKESSSHHRDWLFGKFGFFILILILKM